MSGSGPRRPDEDGIEAGERGGAGGIYTGARPAGTLAVWGFGPSPSAPAAWAKAGVISEGSARSRRTGAVVRRSRMGTRT